MWGKEVSADKCPMCKAPLKYRRRAIVEYDIVLVPKFEDETHISLVNVPKLELMSGKRTFEVHLYCTNVKCGWAKDE